MDSEKYGIVDTSSRINESDMSNITDKTPCIYGDKCYRTNTDHLKLFSHS